MEYAQFTGYNRVDLLRLVRLIIDESRTRYYKLISRNGRLDLNLIPESETELPLHLACWEGRWSINDRNSNVSLLLDAGADPKAFCKNGRNALQCAAAHGALHTDLVALLIKPLKDEDAKYEYVNSLDQHKKFRATHYATAHYDQFIDGPEVLDLVGASWTLNSVAESDEMTETKQKAFKSATKDRVLAPSDNVVREMRKSFTPCEWAAKTGHWIMNGRIAYFHAKKPEQRPDRWLHIEVQNVSIRVIKRTY